MKLIQIEDRYWMTIDEIRPGLEQLAKLSGFEPADQVIEYTKIVLNTLEVFWRREDLAAADQDDINWLYDCLSRLSSLRRMR